jgi:Ca2+-binding RTX toxin-like protein
MGVVGRRLALLALVAAAALAWPASSFAATGQLDNGTMVYRTDQDGSEANNVTLTLADDGFGNLFYLVVDAPAVTIAATPPCENGFNGEQNQMKCPTDGGGQPPPVRFSASLGDGNDSITLIADIPTSVGAGGGSDTMTGGPAADFLRGGQGVDSLDGSSGNDELIGDDPFDPTKPETAFGGNDFINGNAGNDTIDGEAGDDTVRGSTGDDTVSGGDGNDRILAEADADGRDVLNGGNGVDTATYENHTDPLSLSLDDQPNDGSPGSSSDNIHSDVENLVGGSAGDTLAGSAQGNALDGGGGDDNLTGNAGDDSLTGAPGNDTESGGDGNDTADGGDGNDSVAGDSGDDTLRGAAGADALNGGDGNDSESGGDGNDSIGGGDGADSMNGDAGDDSLDAGAGADTMAGDAGDDSLDGGAGPDVFGGGDGVDTGNYQSRANGVAVTLDGTAGDGEPGEGDNVQTDVENLLGGSGADTFIGSAAGNTLDGGAGEDYSDGGAGSDSLVGGDSGDVLRTRGSGEADTVSCGPGPDFVVAKPADTIAPDCDRADRGVNQRPKRRDSAVVAPARGTLQMSPAGILRRVPLQDKVVLPLKSTVDTVAGAVKITSAPTTRKTETVSLREGAFDITQFALTGGDFSACPTAGGRRASAAVARQSASKTVRHLWSNGKGSFRTKGRYASATVRGTNWETVDRCDGTLIKVKAGAVTVRDLVKRKTVVVRAGRSYLAKR